MAAPVCHDPEYGSAMSRARSRAGDSRGDRRCLLMTVGGHRVGRALVAPATEVRWIGRCIFVWCRTG
jgi:hypothetical protein